MLIASMMANQGLTVAEEEEEGDESETEGADSKERRCAIQTPVTLPSSAELHSFVLLCSLTGIRSSAPLLRGRPSSSTPTPHNHAFFTTIPFAPFCPTRGHPGTTPPRYKSFKATTPVLCLSLKYPNTDMRTFAYKHTTTQEQTNTSQPCAYTNCAVCVVKAAVGNEHGG